MPDTPSDFPSDHSSTPPRLAVPYTPERSRLRWLALLIILPCVGAILGLVVALVSGYVLPKKYESVAVVQVHPPQLTGAIGSERFLQTEFEVIRARETLKRVIHRLDLRVRWNGMEEGEVIRALQAMVRTGQIRGTDLVEIRVRHSNPQDARDVANAVAIAYRERRNQVEEERASKALQALDTEVRAQEDLVEEKRKLFHTIVKAVGIPYVEGVDGSGKMGQAEEAILRNAQKEEAALEAEKGALEQEIKTILRLNQEELLTYLVLSDRSQGLKEKQEAYVAKANELELERSRLAADDPKLQELEKQKELLQSDLHRGVVGYREKLQTDLQLIDGRLEKMKENVDVRRDDAVDKALQSQDFTEAKADYEASKATLEAMKIQHSTQRIALKIPKNTITIHEEPVMAKAPSSPKLNGLMLGGILIGGAGGLLLALPIAGLMLLRG